jgi:hypothetical protein
MPCFASNRPLETTTTTTTTAHPSGSLSLSLSMHLALCRFAVGGMDYGVAKGANISGVKVLNDTGG